MKYRTYINITNRCTYACPFCCMFSSPKNKTDMGLSTFYAILQDIQRKHTEDPAITFEVQIEGGEPLLHPDLYLFLEMLTSQMMKPIVDKIIIDTNGALLMDAIDKIVEIAERKQTDILLKASINGYILKKRPDAIEVYKNIDSSLEFVPHVDLRFNVRYYDDIERDVLIEKIGRLKDKSSIFSFNAYGRLDDHPTLPKPIIKKETKDWWCYACDGRNFGEDLEARSKAELEIARKEVSHENA